MTRKKRVNTNSIKLDGVNDHVLVPDQDLFSFGDGSGNDKPFTFSAWVFVEDVTGGDEGPFITKGEVGGGTNIEYIFKHRQGQLRAFIYRGDNTGTNNRIRLQADAASISDATWTHVVLTYDGSLSENGIKFYTNGLEIASTAGKDGDYAGGGGTRNSTQPLIIGKTNNAGANAAQTYEDRMADVCIFNKELSAAEVSELYNSGKVKDMTKASTYDNLISWWKMGDDRDHADTGGVIDYINGFNGTLTNGAHIRYEPDLGTDFITLTDNHIYTSFGRTLSPKGLNRYGTRLSQVIWVEYNDIVKGSNSDRQIPSSTYYVDGNVYKTINGVDTLISYNTENQRYLHITADLTNYSRTNILVVPWYWYYGNQIFVRFAGLGNPLLGPGISNVASINYTNDLQLLAGTKSQVSSKVLELYGADKVFFQVFTSEGISLNSAGGSESDDILIFAGANTF